MEVFTSWTAPGMRLGTCVGLLVLRPVMIQPSCCWEEMSRTTEASSDLRLTCPYRNLLILLQSQRFSQERAQVSCLPSSIGCIPGKGLGRSRSCCLVQMPRTTLRRLSQAWKVWRSLRGILMFSHVWHMMRAWWVLLDTFQKRRQMSGVRRGGGKRVCGGGSEIITEGWKQTAPTDMEMKVLKSLQ